MFCRSFEESKFTGYDHGNALFLMILLSNFLISKSSCSEIKQELFIRVHFQDCNFIALLNLHMLTSKLELAFVVDQLKTPEDFTRGNPLRDDSLRLANINRLKKLPCFLDLNLLYYKKQDFSVVVILNWIAKKRFKSRS